MHHVFSFQIPHFRANTCQRLEGMSLGIPHLGLGHMDQKLEPLFYNNNDFICVAPLKLEVYQKHN